MPWTFGRAPIGHSVAPPGPSGCRGASKPIRRSALAGRPRAGDGARDRKRDGTALPGCMGGAPAGRSRTRVIGARTYCPKREERHPPDACNGCRLSERCSCVVKGRARCGQDRDWRRERQRRGRTRHLSRPPRPITGGRPPIPVARRTPSFSRGGRGRRCATTLVGRAPHAARSPGAPRPETTVPGAGARGCSDHGERGGHPAGGRWPVGPGLRECARRAAPRSGRPPGQVAGPQEAGARARGVAGSGGPPGRPAIGRS